MKKVTSREYKVVLRASRFAGDRRALRAAARVFWHDFSRLAADVARGAHGGPRVEGRGRQIVFFDTANRLLHASGYILRERRDLATGRRELTLKFRHQDRYLAQSRGVQSAAGRGRETKFEEDIKPPFVSLYSHSTTVRVGKKWIAARLGDAGRIFPALRKKVEGFHGDAALQPVRGFRAHELVLAGGGVDLGKRPKGGAGCALIVWYDERRSDEPVVVEFSFRYGDRREAFSGATSRRAFDLFAGMQKRLKAWIDPSSRTKTRFVYR